MHLFPPLHLYKSYWDGLGDQAQSQCPPSQTLRCVPCKSVKVQGFPCVKSWSDRAFISSLTATFRKSSICVTQDIIFSAHWELKPSNGVIWCLQTAHHFHPCKLSHACTGIHVHKTHSSFKSDLRETRAYDSSSQQQIKTLQKTHLAVRRHHYLQKCIEWKPFSRGALSPCNLGGRRGAQNERVLSCPLVMSLSFSAHLPW